MQRLESGERDVTGMQIGAADVVDSHDWHSVVTERPHHDLRCLLGSDFVAWVVMFSFPFLSTINSQRSTVSNAKCLDATPFFVPAPLPLIHDRFLQIFARLF